MIRAAVFFTLVLVMNLAAEDWPQWRGPDASGVSSDKRLPVEWNAEKNILWKTPLAGRGFSSPVVSGDRIFVTTVIEGEEVIPEAKPVIHFRNGAEYRHPDAVGADRKYTFKVLAIHRDTGKVLWEATSYEGLVKDTRHRKNSYASATPVTDGKTVYAFFGPEGVYAYDWDGKLKWKSAAATDIHRGLGTGTSPVLHDNLLILLLDEDNGEQSALVAYDKNTGKELWRAKRKNASGWSTPIIVRHQGRAQIVAVGNGDTVAYDPDSGKEIWRAGLIRGNAVPTPLAGHGMVYAYIGYPDKRVTALQLGGSGDISETGIVWKYDKGTAYVPSSILYGDYVYLVSDKGILTCLDAKTGEVQYDNGRVPNPVAFFASPVAYDGKIFMTSEDGDTYVIQAGPKHEILHTNSLGEPVYASPALSNGRVFIRGSKNLYAIGK